jgi:hypothetical protein
MSIKLSTLLPLVTTPLNITHLTGPLSVKICSRVRKCRSFILVSSSGNCYVKNHVSGRRELSSQHVSNIWNVEEIHENFMEIQAETGNNLIQYRRYGVHGSHL